MFRRLFSGVTVVLCIASIFPFGIRSCQNFHDRVDPPFLSPSGGIYNSAQNVTISCQTADAKIRYSYDYIFGQNFKDNENWLYYAIAWENLKENSIIYTKPIEVNSTKRIRTQAFKKGMADSAEVWVTYIIKYPVETPKFSKKSGIWIAPLTIEILCNTRNSTIRYTTDGSDPTETSSIYNSPITINATTSFKAKGFLKEHPDSATAEANYTIVEPGKHQLN